MAVKIGILGIGFMGSTHFRNHTANPAAKVAAICDIDPVKRSGDWSGIAGNIGAKAKKVDLRGIKVYDKAEKMFADPGLDAIDICLPTYLHAQYAVKALKAGKHVICEKPLARTAAEAAKVVAAAKQAKKMLFTGHCIRFWPEYAKTAELIKSGKLGKVLSAMFIRCSPTPTWSWSNWLMDSKKSGDAALDLHIHDTDFVLYAFGKPKAVTSIASGFKKGRADHILTTYHYAGNALITAEGAWEYAPATPFRMIFRVAFEKGTVELCRDGKLMLYPAKGAASQIACPVGDGWQLELLHYVKCIASGKASPVVTPESALQSVKLVEAELKSAKTGKRVTVKL